MEDNDPLKLVKVSSGINLKRHLHVRLFVTKTQQKNVLAILVDKTHDKKENDPACLEAKES